MNTIAHGNAPRSATAGEVYEIIRLVRPLFRHLYKAVEDALAGTGVTIPMRGVLEALETGGLQTVPQIARTLMVQRQFTQVVVNALTERGWVEPLSNRAHKRSPLLRLTPEGAATLAAVKAHEFSVIERVASDLPADDVEACRRTLTELTAYFGAVAGRRALDREAKP